MTLVEFQNTVGYLVVFLLALLIITIKRMNFGALRVLNDDKIAAGHGFGMHPHRDMEIISIPLFGELAHKDNIGNELTIGPDEVQVMSAGSGVVHSEMNPSHEVEGQFLQIWIETRQKVFLLIMLMESFQF